MKFILQLWPDIEERSPEELLAYALESIATNPDLSWSILTDSGEVITDDVRGGIR